MYTRRNVEELHEDEIIAFFVHSANDKEVKVRLNGEGGLTMKKGQGEEIFSERGEEHSVGFGRTKQSDDQRLNRIYCITLSLSKLNLFF